MAYVTAACFMLLYIIHILHFAFSSRDVRWHAPLSTETPFRRLSATRQQFGRHRALTVLNTTSPPSLKAKMYSYGEDTHDHRMPPWVSVSKDGALGFSPSFASNEINAFPIDHEVIAVFWTETSFGSTGQVHFRETADPHVLSTAASKVQSQFRLGGAFTPSSVFVVTWENLAPNSKPPPSGNDQVVPKNTFQIALIMSMNGTFAHFIYNELNWHGNATIGFNKGDGRIYFNMPWSGGSQALNVKENSNMGIPGEWLFKLDDPSGIHLCAPGIKSLHCSSKCEKNEFSYDCTRRCHCLQDEECNHITGRCPSERCKSGWTNAPSCDIDVDECSAVANPCPENLPDCTNKPGTYECECLTGNVKNLKHLGKFSLYTNIENSKEGERKPKNLSDQISSQPIAFKPQQISEFVYNPFRPVPLQGVSYRNKILTQSSSALPVNPLAIKPLTNSWPGWMLPEQRANSKSILCTKQCNQNSHCALINGTERCQCNTGWTGDGQYCVDINECLQDNPCPINAKCINTYGSYDCQCPSGFISNGIVCTDVDECAEGIARCPERSVCVNTNGSYICQCREGYNGEPGSEIGCVDVNECLLPHVYCGPNAECKNTVGSYACECHAGFQPNIDGTNGCEDIDECQTKPCSKAATCTNKPGSFKCTCNATYNGNGFHCERSKLFTVGMTEADTILDHQHQWTTINLKSPLRFLQTDHNKLHISSNGIIGFDSPITTYKEPTKLGNALMPFYHKVNLEKGGKVYIQTLTNGTFLSELITLFREVEGLRALKAHQVIIVTYENVKAHPSSESTGSTFQCVLVGFDIATYVIFIYDTVQPTEAKAGIQATNFSKSVYLPFSRSNAYELTVKSNIGIPGKWIYRIDLEYIPKCPSGYSDAPLCLSDINECKFTEFACHKHAICINTPGSYVCQCKRGYSGDGRQCFYVDPCYTETGAVCGDNAQCFVPAFHRSKPECVCNDGFIGDGFFCTPIPDTMAHEQQSGGIQLFLGSPKKVEIHSQLRTEKPVVQLRSNKPSKSRTQEENTGDSARSQLAKVPFNDDDAVQAVRHESTLNVQNSSAYISGTDDDFNLHESLETASSAMKLLIITVPTVLTVVWLSLVVLLVKVCTRRKQNQQRSTYSLEPFHIKQLSTASSGAYETCGSLLNGYSFSQMNSRENMPRTSKGNVRYGQFI
ncbi:hypothetical protein M514_03139 [Trichuris suis]|uniref:EGF-like domain protein n=1 Tax=Trichuris suis TaxID=68888 RepID=A0A085NFI4_9BILA|nr:hypothetical protein M514_03139 [Trichuris suis]